MLCCAIRKLGLRWRRYLAFVQSGERPLPGASSLTPPNLFPFPWAMACLSAADQYSASSLYVYPIREVEDGVPVDRSAQRLCSEFSPAAGVGFDEVYFPGLRWAGSWDGQVSRRAATVPVDCRKPKPLNL